MNKSVYILILPISLLLIAGCSPSENAENNVSAKKTSTVSGTTIEIELPELVNAQYLVPVHNPPKGLKEKIVDAVKLKVKGPTRELTLHLLDSVAAQTELTSIDHFPKELINILAAAGASEEQLSILKANKQVVAIGVAGLPRWPPYNEFAARAAAGAFASEQKSVVVDLSTPKMLSADQALEALPNAQKSPRISDWITVISSASGDGLWMTTKGLGRVGLPELQITEAPRQFQKECSAMLTELASKILIQLGEKAHSNTKLSKLDLPSEIEISEPQSSTQSADKNANLPHASVHLRLAPGPGDDAGFLNIEAPADYKGNSNEYLPEVCRQLFGAQRDETIKAALTPEMQKAMNTAKAGLASIRTRFNDKKLPTDSVLIVKFRVTRMFKTEYLWAKVTNWSKASELDGICGNDAELDPTLKNGSPVHLKLSSIVDWAVLVDGKVTEGGWTNQLLTE